MSDLKPLLGTAPADLAAHLESMGEPAFRGKQVLEWVYRHLVTQFDQMSSLPLGLREKLAQQFTMPRIEVAEALEDPKSHTTKLLLLLEDKKMVECVVLGNRDRGPTLCLSSQVGCAMGCGFCATGLLGPLRNLSVEEILFQVHRALAYLKQKGLKHENPNIVFMGMGEPLINRRNVFTAIARMTDPEGFGFGQRRITVSTVGVAPGIREMADLPQRINLAFSLHHADPAERQKLIPRAFSSLEEVLEGLGEYSQKTKRLVTFEYVMLKDVNDRAEDAKKLVQLLRKFRHPTLVNLIPFNPVRDVPFSRSTRESTDRFLGILEKAGVRATLRRTQGTEIDAACGQLALTGYRQQPGPEATGLQESSPV